jgi:hypothetical protein
MRLSPSAKSEEPDEAAAALRYRGLPRVSAPGSQGFVPPIICHEDRYSAIHPAHASLAFPAAVSCAGKGGDNPSRGAEAVVGCDAHMADALQGMQVLLVVNAFYGENFLESVVRASYSDA